MLQAFIEQWHIIVPERRFVGLKSGSHGSQRLIGLCGGCVN